MWPKNISRFKYAYAIETRGLMVAGTVSEGTWKKKSILLVFGEVLHNLKAWKLL